MWGLFFENIIIMRNCLLTRDSKHCLKSIFFTSTSYQCPTRSFFPVIQNILNYLLTINITLINFLLIVMFRKIIFILRMFNHPMRFEVSNIESKYVTITNRILDSIGMQSFSENIMCGNISRCFYIIDFITIKIWCSSKTKPCCLFESSLYQTD